MTNRYLATIIGIFAMTAVLAQATYTTNAATVNWQTGPWSISGVDSDMDGIPDSNDDVVVLAGHTLDWSSANVACEDLTINATGNIQGPPNLSRQIEVFGDYDMDGTELQRGIYVFKNGPGTTISGTGTFKNNVVWSFHATRTIAADVTVSKKDWVRLYNGADVTNNGTITFQRRVLAFSGTSTLTNNGTMRIWAAEFMETGSFDASAVGNQVTIVFTLGNAGVDIPRTTSGFYNLTISTTVKTPEFDENIIVANDFRINSSVSCDMNGFSLNVAGDFTNFGTLTNTGALRTVTMDGAGAQTLTHPAAQAFPANLQISSGGTVTLTNSIDINNGGGIFLTTGTFDRGGNNINLEGNWTRTAGTMTYAASGTVEFDGTAAQTISGPLAGSTEFFNLEADNAAGVSIIAGAHGVSGFLRVSQGTFTSAGFLTMRSSAAGDSRIASLCGTCSVAGNVNVQRYLSGNGDFSDLAAPVTGATLGMWDDDIYMSCVGGDDGNAWGGGSCYVSAKFWDETTQSFSDMADIGDPISNRRGYEVWVADDLASSTVDTTITVTGTIHASGSLGSSYALRTGWNLVGNPYASAIDFDAIGRVNVNNHFMIFDSSTGTYELYDGATGTGMISDDGIIASGQGFWIEGTGGGKSISIDQGDKSSDNTAFVKTTDHENSFANYLYVNITSSINDYSCRSIFKLEDDATSFKDNYDAPYFPSRIFDAPYVGFITEDMVDVRINAVDRYELEHHIPVGVRVGVAGDYTITTENLANFNGYECVTLEDMVTGQIYDLKKNNVITFPMKSIDIVEHRFTLHLDNGCQNEALRMDEFNDVTILPNDFGALVSFNYPAETQATIELFDLTGRVVMAPLQVDAYINTNEVIVPEELSGIFLMVVTSEYGQVTRKVNF